MRRHYWHKKDIKNKTKLCFWKLKYRKGYFIWKYRNPKSLQEPKIIQQCFLCVCVCACMWFCCCCCLVGGFVFYLFVCFIWIKVKEITITVKCTRKNVQWKKCHLLSLLKGHLTFYNYQVKPEALGLYLLLNLLYLFVNKLNTVFPQKYPVLKELQEVWVPFSEMFLGTNLTI